MLYFSIILIQDIVTFPQMGWLHDSHIYVTTNYVKLPTISTAYEPAANMGPSRNQVVKQ